MDRKEIEDAISGVRDFKEKQTKIPESIQNLKRNLGKGEKSFLDQQKV